VRTLTFIPYVPDSSEIPGGGRTLLHGTAARSSLSYNNSECREAWKYMLDELDQCEAWRKCILLPWLAIEVSIDNKLAPNRHFSNLR
jgi:hypothetical protein